MEKAKTQMTPHGLAQDMASALEQAIMRMEDVERQKQDAYIAKVWLPSCEAALVHAKVSLEAWRNHVKT